MLVPNSPTEEMVQSVLGSMADLSAQLPPEKPGDAAMVPIATLDLNIGVSLPAEELVGSLPQVSVAPLVRLPAWVCVVKILQV